MTLEEMRESVPDELRVKPESLPEDIRTGMTYIITADALRDAGTPESEIPTFAEWKASRG